SRKQPTNSISRLASSRNCHGSVAKVSTHCAISSVVRVAVSIQPKIEAAATMKSTVDEVSTVSMHDLTSVFRLSVRYHTRPRNNAHTQAAMAPSVAVKRPVVMQIGRAHV